jgi:hypothetical protein
VIDALSQPVRGVGAQAFSQHLKNCRRECRQWARRVRPLAQREADTKILVNVLDLLEEFSPLHPDECALHCTVVQALHSINAEKLAFWRQHYNLQLAVEWDENSRFFHTCASGRRFFLATERTVVMLNGVPGRWISHCRGLWQGDPISLYLFIIVADVCYSDSSKMHLGKGASITRSIPL